MSEQVNEADILFAEKDIKIDGKTVDVRPYSWAGTIKIAKPLTVIAKTVVENVDSLNEVLKVLEPKESEDGIKTAGLPEQIIAIANFIAGVKNQDELIHALSEMVATSTGLLVEDIKTLMIDDMYKLSKAVYDVNKAFFDKRLASMMKKNPSEKQKK